MSRVSGAVCRAVVDSAALAVGGGIAAVRANPPRRPHGLTNCESISFVCCCVTEASHAPACAAEACGCCCRFSRCPSCSRARLQVTLLHLFYCFSIPFPFFFCWMVLNLYLWPESESDISFLNFLSLLLWSDWINLLYLFF